MKIKEKDNFLYEWYLSPLLGLIIMFIFDLICFGISHVYNEYQNVFDIIGTILYNLFTIYLGYCYIMVIVCSLKMIDILHNKKRLPEKWSFDKKTAFMVYSSPVSFIYLLMKISELKESDSQFKKIFSKTKNIKKNIADA